MKLRRPLLLAFPLTLAVACNRTIADQDAEETSSTDTDNDTDGSEGGSTSGGPEDTEGWQTPPLDLGDDWEPRFGCDEPDAIIPEGVECEDAIPGDEAPPEDQQAVAEAFGEECTLERMCGDNWGVDCQAQTDGPYHYVDPETLEVVATCGGACWVEECEDCPPQGWNCPIL